MGRMKEIWEDRRAEFEEEEENESPFETEKDLIFWLLDCEKCYEEKGEKND